MSDTPMQALTPSQSSPEIPINENFETLRAFAVYGKRQPATSGLSWGYYSGRWGGFSIAEDVLVLTGSATNYIVVEIATGAITVDTAATDWNDTTNFARVYKITTGVSTVTDVEDHRFGPGGISGGAGGGSSVSVAGLEFTASSTTTDSDPGAGTLRWNNATHASATILYIDNTDADATSLATLWASLTVGAFLTIQHATSPDVWQTWKVTGVPIDGTGYYKFPVTLQAQEGGTISGGAAIRIDVDGGSGTGGTATASTVLTSSSGVCNVDCSLGDYFTFPLTENVTSLTFSNLPGSGKGTTKMIRITQDSTPRTFTWPGSFEWDGGTPGAISTGASVVDLLSISTFNNGSVWDATLSNARS